MQYLKQSIPYHCERSALSVWSCCHPCLGSEWGTPWTSGAGCLQTEEQWREFAKNTWTTDDGASWSSDALIGLFFRFKWSSGSVHVLKTVTWTRPAVRRSVTHERAPGHSPAAGRRTAVRSERASSAQCGFCQGNPHPAENLGSVSAITMATLFRLELQRHRL